MSCASGREMRRGDKDRYHDVAKGAMIRHSSGTIPTLFPPHSSLPLSVMPPLLQAPQNTLLLFFILSFPRFPPTVFLPLLLLFSSSRSSFDALSLPSMLFLPLFLFVCPRRLMSEVIVRLRLHSSSSSSLSSRTPEIVGLGSGPSVQDRFRCRCRYWEVTRSFAFY
ncbi:hypothetical protein FB446DRAFT_493342 [Lentinula raphanica]|nr:hypothetical protein FB446DRAFT_493342 [Lentinula raphanica]